MIKLYEIAMVFATALSVISCTNNTTKTNADSQKFIAALEAFEPYASTQWSECQTVPNSGYWGSGVSGEREGLPKGITPNDGIRAMNGIALSNAVLIMANPDSKLNDSRLEHIEKVLRYSSQTHKKSGYDYTCVDGYQWGLGWQTNMWAGSMGFTCALMEERLPKDLVADVKKVVAAEADYRVSLPPGSDYIGNTIAEENAWNSNIVSLAASWMSDDKRAAQWLECAKIYLVNSYSVDDDKQGEMAKWSSTINLYPSFMLENHGFYHPGYHNVTGSSLGDSFLMAQLTNEKVAEELKPFVEHNVLNVWEKVKNVVKRNGELFFPCGQDWSLHNYGHVAYTSYIATHFKQPEAVYMQNRIIDLLRHRQSLFGTGEFIGRSNENTLYVEAVTARRIALAWLHNYVNDFELVEPKPLANFSDHADDVKIITSRSDKGNISLSYGRRVLVAVESEPQDSEQGRYIYCSDNLSLIGHTPFGDVDSTALRSCDLMESGFTASLNLYAQGDLVQSDIFASDGVLIIIQSPKGDALDQSKGDSFKMSFENYIMNGSKRDIYSCEGIQQIAEASGVSCNLGSIMNVSNLYGVIYGPDAEILYVAPENYNRRGASTDSVSSKLGDPFAPSYTIILCNEDWNMTQRCAQSVKFVCEDGKSTLSFVAPDGETINFSTQL